jgi:hypothetical protein
MRQISILYPCPKLPYFLENTSRVCASKRPTRYLRAQFQRGRNRPENPNGSTSRTLPPPPTRHTVFATIYHDDDPVSAMSSIMMLPFSQCVYAPSHMSVIIWPRMESSLSRTRERDTSYRTKVFFHTTRDSMRNPTSLSVHLCRSHVFRSLSLLSVRGSFMANSTGTGISRYLLGPDMKYCETSACVYSVQFPSLID